MDSKGNNKMTVEGNPVIIFSAIVLLFCFLLFNCFSIGQL